MARVAQGVLQRDAAAVRVAEDGDLLVTEVGAQRVGVVGELRERERRERRPARATVAAVVVVDEAERVAERIEPLAELRVVDAEPAVHDEQRRATADFQVEELSSVDCSEWHRSVRDECRAP